MLTNHIIFTLIALLAETTGKIICWKRVEETWDKEGFALECPTNNKSGRKRGGMPGFPGWH